VTGIMLKNISGRVKIILTIIFVLVKMVGSIILWEYTGHKE